MSIEEIIQLIQAVSENKLTSFELEEGNMKLLSLIHISGCPWLRPVTVESMSFALMMRCL